MSQFAQSPEGQLRAHLAENVGQGVFDAIEASEVAIGNRPAPAQPDPPVVAAPAAVPVTPVQADPAQVPAASPETVKPAEGQPGVERLLLGKYKTEAEAEKGYHELLRMNKLLLQERDSRPETVIPSATPAAPEAVVTAPAVSERLKQIEEITGVPATDLEAALTEIARDVSRKEAESTYKRITEPMEKRQLADAYMEDNFPEAVKFSDEIAQFVKTDPLTQSVVGNLWRQGHFQEAMVIGYNNWKLNMGAQQEHSLNVAEEVRKEEVALARVDAGLMSTNAQSSRENVEQGVTQEEFDKLNQLAKAGYHTPLLRATIGRMLPDSVFGANVQG